jgi:probable HAF family extracellular repeat protein
VAGSTLWDHDGDGVFFMDTRVGFSWSPDTGPQIFTIDDALYWDPNFQIPKEISSTGTVIGNDLFRNSFLVLPFVFTTAHGFNFLPLPCSSTSCNGGVNAISKNGQIVVGSSREGISGEFPTRALRWTVTGTEAGQPLQLARQPLPTSDPWSNAWGVSADGSVIVGDSGTSDGALRAVRWVNGTLQPLPVAATSSTARWSSGDGTVAIGLATTPIGTVLVRWDAAGAATTAIPPRGASVATIAAINPTGTAAVGSLSFQGNRAPFLWTLADGFTVLPEAGREQAYDTSEALDVSDDGAIVVGALQASMVTNGDPPMRGFLWTRATGMIFIEDLLTGAGFANQGIYRVSTISGDGKRILATGTFPHSNRGTCSLVIALHRP